MKKIYILKKTLLLILTLVGFSISSYAANIQWDGGASTTNWNDAANWVGDVIPGAADAAIFPSPVGTITVTGTAPSAVGSLQAWNGVDLFLDLDVTVASTNATVVRIFSGSTITVKSGATLTVTVTGTNAAAINLYRDNSTFNIESGGTVDFTAWRGIGSNNLALTAAVNNYGTMNITSSNAAIQPNNPTAMTIINHPCGVINLLTATTSGKIKVWSNAATSSIINNGFIYYAGSTAPISATSATAPNVATNNAFYQTASGTPGFSSGSSTSQTNNGVLVNSTVALDAGTGCDVDINGANTGMQSFTWAFGGSDIGANSTNGILDLTGAGFPNLTGPHTITVSDAGCSTYNTEFTVTVANICALSALPVELTTFSATQKDKVNILKWQTASEINNAYFEVQSSTDGRDFTTMEIIEGNGSTFEASNYEYVDAQPRDITYYRLQQYDYDGASEKSNIVVVERSGISNDEVSLFPLPVNDVLSVKYNSSSKEDMTILVMDITGRILSIQEEVTTKGSNLFEVDFSNIPAGSYFIRLQLRNQSIVERVINQ